MLLSTTFNTSICEPPRFLSHNAILANSNFTNSKKIHNEPITVLIFVKLTSLQYKLTCHVWSWSMYTLSCPPYLQLYRPWYKRAISPPRVMINVSFSPQICTLHLLLYTSSNLHTNITSSFTFSLWCHSYYLWLHLIMLWKLHTFIKLHVTLSNIFATSSWISQTT
jgi:hypothetical protein